MKRDWSIIKDILEAIEQNKARTHWGNLPDDDARNAVLMHYELLQESGLIANFKIATDTDDDFKVTRAPQFIPQVPGEPYLRLTMKGFDFLEVLRDQRLWQRILAFAKNSSVKLTYEFIKQAIPIIYKQLL